MGVWDVGVDVDVEVSGGAGIVIESGFDIEIPKEGVEGMDVLAGLNVVVVLVFVLVFRMASTDVECVDAEDIARRRVGGGQGDLR